MIWRYVQKKFHEISADFQRDILHWNIPQTHFKAALLSQVAASKHCIGRHFDGLMQDRRNSIANAMCGPFY